MLSAADACEARNMNTKLWHEHKWTTGVPINFEFPAITVHKLLEDAAQQYAEYPFVIFKGHAQTFAQVDTMANQVANYLRTHGVRRGDRVALFLPNVPHFPAVFFGILKAGAISVTCNPTYTVPELNYQLKDSGARCLFAMDHPSLYKTTCAALHGTAVETVVLCNVSTFLPLHERLIGQVLGKIPHVAHHEPDHLMFDELLKRTPATKPDLPIHPQDDLALIQYTGGTTGTPKGASVTHANIVANLYAITAWVRPVDEQGNIGSMTMGGECFIGVLPWYHAFGLVMTLLAAVKLASKLVCVPDPRAGTPPFTELLWLIAHHRATVLNGVPTLFSAIINHAHVDRFDLRTLKLCGCGAAPLAPEVARQFEAKTGAVLYEGYGMTEASAGLICNPTNRRDRKLGTLGLPLPGTDVLVLDLDTGTRELPPGEDGELAANGAQIMAGYWNRPAENTAAFREINGKRYLLTGDIGHMDEEGFFILTDRKKDIVIVGGYKAYPKEIEEVLYTHPAVALAAVIGVPDSRMGQIVKAFIKLKDGHTASSRELIQFCKERLATYKVPRSIEFRDNLPVSLVGKVMKRELRSEEPSTAEIDE
jgi:long-chain acyl-CoA synthetase